MAQATDQSPTALCVARQPILDEHGQVFGYELLYRGAPGDTTCAVKSELASASVITSAMLDLGLDTLTGGRRAFLNVTGSLVIEQIDALVPPGDVVLELLETIEITDELIAACRKLKAKGYVLALDDFVGGSAAEALLPYVSFVKVDVLNTPMPEVIELAKRLKPLGVTMLAEKVESREVYEQTRDAGYTLFQGYYFCKPVIQMGAAIPAHQLVYIRLLAALSKPDLSMHGAGSAGETGCFTQPARAPVRQLRGGADQDRGGIDSSGIAADWNRTDSQMGVGVVPRRAESGSDAGIDHAGARARTIVRAGRRALASPRCVRAVRRRPVFAARRAVEQDDGRRTRQSAAARHRLPMRCSAATTRNARCSTR